MSGNTHGKMVRNGNEGLESSNSAHPRHADMKEEDVDVRERD